MKSGTRLQFIFVLALAKTEPVTVKPRIEWVMREARLIFNEE